MKKISSEDEKGERNARRLIREDDEVGFGSSGNERETGEMGELC